MADPNEENKDTLPTEEENSQVQEKQADTQDDSNPLNWNQGTMEIKSSSSDDERQGWGFSGWGWKPRPEKDPKKMWEDEEKLSLEDRRKRYLCGKHFVTNDQIPTWQAFSQKYLEKVKIEELNEGSKVTPRKELNEKIGIFHGDIVTLELDAVVNAANEGCLGGGGIDGAIHRAAGDMLYEECRTLHGCPTGQTKITRGYNLPAKFVLHSVGPMWTEPEALQSCYKTVLALVKKHQIKTVALCGISTGIFGYPLYPATKIALKTIRDWLEKDDNYKLVDKITICTFNNKERIAYHELLPMYFPAVAEGKEPVAEVKEEEKTDQKTVDNNNNNNNNSTEKAE